MIISRTTFSLRYGQAKPAIAIWKEILDHGKGKMEAPGMRLMSDLSGPHYTLVLDLNLKSFMDFGPTGHVWSTNEKIRELYPKFLPLCERSVGDMYHLEHQVGEAPTAGCIIEQMTFRMKFGQIKEGCAIWRQILDIGRTNGLRSRMMADVTGESYTIVMEQMHRSMMDYGPHMHAWLSDDRLKELYARFIPLCDRSRRTLYKVEHIV